MAVKHNLIANFIGNAWTGLMGLAFVPIYLRFIGSEGYGLVGFFAMISAVLTILDGGFGVAASRELARTQSSNPTAGAEHSRDLNDLIRTLEWGFWGVAMSLGAVMILLAPWIEAYWLRVQIINDTVAITALRLMGVALILQWPSAYYRGCIIGLQRQIGLNTIGASVATVKGVGAVLILWLYSPTIQAFFAWQIFVAFINVFVLRRFLWSKMPAAVYAPRFSIDSLRRVGHFAAGVGVTNVLALILTQVDKVLLSKVLPLGQFGYYTLAATLAGVIYQFIGPVFNAFYPRLNQVVAAGNQAEVALVYHRACQIMALSIVPISLLMVFFSRDMVWVWTGNAELASTIRWVVAGLALGTMFNGMMTIPYALQLANGWTMLAFWQNVIAVCVLAPTLYLSATRFGLIGAAMVWPFLNISYVLFGAPLMYRRLLANEERTWFLESIFIPVAVAVGVIWPATLVITHGRFAESKPIVVSVVACAFLVTCILTGYSMPQIRHTLLKMCRNNH